QNITVIQGLITTEVKKKINQIIIRSKDGQSNAAKLLHKITKEIYTKTWKNRCKNILTTTASNHNDQSTQNVTHNPTQSHRSTNTDIENNTDPKTIAKK
ncbi:384_t:CDS:1, partial [Cetraspora pellucida]